MLFLTLLFLCELNKCLQSEPAGAFVDSVILPGFWALGSQVTSVEAAPAAAPLVPLEGSLTSRFSVSLHPPEAAAGFPGLLFQPSSRADAASLLPQCTAARFGSVAGASARLLKSNLSFPLKSER